MSNYVDITGWNATSFTAANRTIDDIDTIVIHHWGVDGQRFDDVCRFFQNGPGTSAHYVVEAGKCAQLVELKDIAWHAGDWNANARSIGIECRPEMSDEDFETLARVIADIETYYGKSFYIHGHKDYFNTACPGRYYDQLDHLIDRVNEIKAGIDNAPAPLSHEQVDEKRAAWEKLMKELEEAKAAGEEVGKCLAQVQ